MVLEHDIEETLDDLTHNGTIVEETACNISAIVAATIEAWISAAMDECRTRFACAANSDSSIKRAVSSGPTQPSCSATCIGALFIQTCFWYCSVSPRTTTQAIARSAIRRDILPLARRPIGTILERGGLSYSVHPDQQEPQIGKPLLIYDFLVGLHSKFDVVRGRILGQRPVPYLMEVCFEVGREEDRTSVMSVPQLFSLISIDGKSPRILDSGAIDHLTGSSEHFVSYITCAGNEKIRIVDDSLAPIVGKWKISPFDGLSLHKDFDGTPNTIGNC
ncbi:Cysteine-rich RLK (RECEPTOR-like protein kinase) 8 [Cucumis melo var. makuwa]|uniref:Cysteine-rich RLK (RECEPTOR-like protein kinase) 8 n=1 Tax=Cucumis melo var. makuwa TaxID=1194695 RepID=A0A5A7TC45_CUCMM|nr:Cysteine-rich RLK (RECEPTOR-like protein kinase) 8 [Cucumis melo var. makuwa]